MIDMLSYLPVPETASAPPVTGRSPRMLTMATLIQNIFFAFPPHSNAETAHAEHQTTRFSESPIYFYDSDKPYFELAKLS